jgi:hypothetical protein
MTWCDGRLYNRRVLRAAIAVLLLTGVAVAQDKPEKKDEKSDVPQVKINYLNVCAPSKDEQTVLENALSSLPSKPSFSPEFEVARGRTMMPEEAAGAAQDPATSATASASGTKPTGAPAVSNWVRIRKEFSSGGLANVQYTFSRDATGMAETLVFRMKSPKRDQPMQVSFEDAATGSTPAQAVAANTAPSRIRVERFGGSSVVLARCPQADQKQYEPFFTRAKTVMSEYRKLLGVQQTVPVDLARVK